MVNATRYIYKIVIAFTHPAYYKRSMNVYNDPDKYFKYCTVETIICTVTYDEKYGYVCYFQLFYYLSMHY